MPNEYRAVIVLSGDMIIDIWPAGTWDPMNQGQNTEIDNAYNRLLKDRIEQTGDYLTYEWRDEYRE